MLAIIIPFYKLTFFEATLQSLANQTDKRFKVYIGDDASPEDCSSLLKQFDGAFDFIYHRFNDNLGGASLIQQWERCIALSKNEEWLMILGDDDVLGDNVVENWYQEYSRFNKLTNVVRFASQLMNEVGAVISNVYLHPQWELASDSFYRKFKRISRSSLSEYIFTRESYTRFGFKEYPLAWNSDDTAWLEFSNGLPIYSINSTIISVRISKLNISGTNENDLYKNKSQIKFYKFLFNTEFRRFESKQQVELMKAFVKELVKFKSLTFLGLAFIIFVCLRFYNPEYVYMGKKLIFKKIKKIFK